MAAISKEALLAKRDIGTETVTLEGIGDVVVRPLSRGEVVRLQKRGELDADVMEQKLLALAMVEPAMTEEEVAAWQDVAPAGEIAPIAEAIERISGLKQKEVKENIKQFRR